MRLIHTTTLAIQEFFDSQIRDQAIEYAILSHCWEAAEVTYQEFLSKQVSHERLKKIEDCCALARDAGLDWAWIDTCCIDKTSSAELSEAINSMFTWYQQSKICFVFLADFVSSEGASPIERLCDCKWWTRGWTLQELLAPRDVRFFDKCLQLIGTKESMADEIVGITGIEADCLTGKRRLRDFSIAQRMSWASHRQTTRIEDVAYCLLGMFEVNVPLLYGEGTKSFQRLQEAIISQSDDETIFTWLSDSDDERGLLAASPSEFACTGNVRPIQYERRRPPSIFTSRGLQISYAYPDPGKMMWEKMTGATFGGVFQPTRERELRLDCELTNAQGRDCWVGIPISKDPTSGTWYRRKATQLLIAPQNGYFQKIYPPLVGYDVIDAKPFNHEKVDTNGEVFKTSYARYNRPTWLALVYQLAETLIALSDLWLFSAMHYVLNLAPPNPLLIWAYMTTVWVLTGSNPSVLASCLIFGLCGLDFVTTYPTLNIYVALLGFVAMNGLQKFFEELGWKDLDQKGLKANIGVDFISKLKRRQTGPWSMKR